MGKLAVIVCIGGATGTLLRYLVGVWFLKHSHYSFPLSTFLINITGSFLIGLFFALFEHYPNSSPALRLFLITGVCGGYTTFSAFAYENVKLLQDGSTLLFFLYSLGSLLVSLVAVVAGIYVVKLFT